MGSSSGNRNISSAIRASRAGTSRVVTAGGRVARLGTANLMQGNAMEFIDSSKINMKKVATRKVMARP